MFISQPRAVKSRFDTPVFISRACHYGLCKRPKIAEREMKNSIFENFP